MRQVYALLLNAFGPRGWWPIDGEYAAGDYSKPSSESQMLEICIGAILTQNTNWSNVEKSLVNLRKEHFFSLKNLSSVSEEKVCELVKI